MIHGDSLRADFRLPLGAGSGALALVGDRGLWAEPEEEVRKLIPNYPLLWALIGQARPPEDRDVVQAYADERMMAWQYVQGADTTNYILTRGAARELVADVRAGGGADWPGPCHLWRQWCHVEVATRHPVPQWPTRTHVQEHDCP